jgi:uncharacterized cupin superfamily protein
VPERGVVAALAGLVQVVGVAGRQVIREAMASADGLDADGFHKTSTIDYVVVLDGAVELVLDEGSAVVEPGEVVVQRGTNHAWRNHGDAAIRLLVVMTSIA